MSEITHQEYGNEIEALAVHINGLADETDTAKHDLIHQEVDNHEWVIYNKYHFDVLEHASDPKEFGPYISDDMGFRELIQALVFCAMYEDLSRAVETR